MAATTGVGRIRVVARSVRITTGLILLAFVSCHLLNASLGLISIAAMDAARPYLTSFWSSPPFGPILFFSLILHFFLGLWSVYERPTLRTNAQDMVQLITGLVVVPVMATHVIAIAMVANAGVQLNYAATIKIMWVDNPTIGLLQILVVTFVWLHGCAGLLVWMRSFEGARTVVLWIYPVAIAIPVLALLGFSEAGRQVLDAAATASQNDLATVSEDSPEPTPQIDFALIQSVTNGVIWGAAGLAVLTLFARALRIAVQKSGTFSVSRDTEDLPETEVGLSLLDAFQVNNQPHASLCQGRGRCGTCAVRIVSSSLPIPEASVLEQQTLVKRDLPADARLACQLKPVGGTISVTALFPAEYTFHDVDDAPSEHEATV